jgi:hypothetical protein
MGRASYIPAIYMYVALQQAQGQRDWPGIGQGMTLHVSYLGTKNDQLRSRELTVGITHLKISRTHTSHSLNMAPVPAPCVCYSSRSEGHDLGVQRVFLN